MVEVTNLDNGKKLVVRVNDRGPFVGGRVIDLSHAAARELGYDRAGTAHVRVRYVGPAPLAGPDAGVRYAQATLPPVVPMAASSRLRPGDEDIFAEGGAGRAGAAGATGEAARSRLGGNIGAVAVGEAHNVGPGAGGGRLPW